jgi:hypothetical protein
MMSLRCSCLVRCPLFTHARNTKNTLVDIEIEDTESVARTFGGTAVPDDEDVQTIVEGIGRASISLTESDADLAAQEAYRKQGLALHAAKGLTIVRSVQIGSC